MSEQKLSKDAMQRIGREQGASIVFWNNGKGKFPQVRANRQGYESLYVITCRKAEALTEESFAQLLRERIARQEEEAL